MVKTVNFILHAFYHIFKKWEKSTSGYNAKWYILLKNFLRYSYKSWFKIVNFLLCVFYHNFKNQGKNEMGWKILDLHSFPTKNRTICLLRAFCIPSLQDFKSSLHPDDLQGFSLRLTSVRRSWTSASYHLQEVPTCRSHRFLRVNRT